MEAVIIWPTVTPTRHNDLATSQVPTGGVLLDRDGVLYPVEEDEHLARLTDGHFVCVRPSHEGMACRVELAA